MFDAIQKCWDLLPRRFRWGLAALFLVMNLSALAQLAMVGSIMPFLQVISETRDIEQSRVVEGIQRFLGPMEESRLLILLGGVVIAAVLFANFVGAAQSILNARFAARLNTYLSTLLLRSYLLRPYPYYLNRNTSEFFRNIFSEVNLVTGGFIGAVMNTVTRSLTILGLSVLLILVSPWITLGAGLFFAASYTGIYFTLRRRLIRAGERRAKCDHLRFKAVSEAFGTLKELKVLRREANFLNAFEKPTGDYFRYQERAQLYSTLPRHIVETVAFAGMIGVALILIRQHEGVAGALPVLGLFAVAGYRLLPAIQGFYACISRLRYYRKSVDLIHDECAGLLHGPLPEGLFLHEAASEATDAGRLRLRRAVELREVAFSYPNTSVQALKGISLTIPARSRIGFCGKSGSGKTTLADIVLGLLQPQTGVMTVDGVIVDQTNRADWQRNCGYVPQEIYLADDTVRRNIAFGIATGAIDDTRIRDAARLANIATFIETELPDGYDTDVGERGVRLSGGQRQRIGIARALYHDPDVLVLDEATSSVDSETERAIVDAVESLAGQKTILMIAHRLTTIRRCDTIAFIENGCIAASGTFDELSADNRRFRDMAEA